VTEWLSERLILEIHADLLLVFGGGSGVRDMSLLDSAINRPIYKQTYEAATVFDLAAAYCYGIARNHPFFDGNKRTAFMAAYTFLGLNGFDLTATEEDAFRTILRVAAGEAGEEDLAKWFQRNSVPSSSNR
jgi:death-on-curing protein